MYIYNDFAGKGLMELMKNLVCLVAMRHRSIIDLRTMIVA